MVCFQQGPESLSSHRLRCFVQTERISTPVRCVSSSRRPRRYFDSCSHCFLYFLFRFLNTILSIFCTSLALSPTHLYSTSPCDISSRDEVFTSNLLSLLDAVQFHRADWRLGEFGFFASPVKISCVWSPSAVREPPLPGASPWGSLP